MIYVIGDSHATCTFKDIKGVIILARRGVTLKRMTYVEDDILINIIKKLPLTNKDYIIFCFGEVDIRCHIKPIIDHRKRTTLDSLLSDWVDRYASRISLLNNKGAKIVIMSVIPPTSKERIIIDKKTQEKIFVILPPAHGLDKERVLYTETINKYLKLECEKRKWIYFDVHSKYVDNKTRMMQNGLGDGTVHIGNVSYVKELLKDLIKGEKLMDTSEIDKIKEFAHLKDEFDFLKNVETWNSHRPLLLAALELTKAGNVLEMGCGNGSTLFLQNYCETNNRILYSYDFVESWANKFNAQFVNGDWEKSDYYSRNYAVALIDESPAEHRGISIKNLIGKVDIFIAHDTELSHDNYYHMLEEINKFKYIFHFHKFNNRATMFSNIYDVEKFMK
jgi:hypothetical protein